MYKKNIACVCVLFVSSAAWTSADSIDMKAMRAMLDQEVKSEMDALQTQYLEKRDRALGEASFAFALGALCGLYAKGAIEELLKTGVSSARIAELIVCSGASLWCLISMVHSARRVGRLKDAKMAQLEQLERRAMELRREINRQERQAREAQKGSKGKKVPPAEEGDGGCPGCNVCSAADGVSTTGLTADGANPAER
ncbi:MAG: hypothetical protein M1549_03840 [Candidatus Dependentiae bacterium]|nr:hypothetical protein [Candidatus Dependentiae bacterium]